MDIIFSDLELDYMNPRFSLFNFENENEIIDYLLKYENLYDLIDSFILEGYNTLGERLIVLEDDDKNIVLEGNRRVAAVKCIFKYGHLLKASYREKIKGLKTENFQLACDVVKNRSDANYKIAAKHIASIKSWNSIDKYVYYYNSFQQLVTTKTISEALEFIQSTTPDSISQIRKDIKFFKFLSQIHSLVKAEVPDLKPLSHLDNDVLTSRVYSALKKELQLHEEHWIELKIPSEKNGEFTEILKLIGKAAWIPNKVNTQGSSLNTRTFQRQDHWNEILNKDEVIPGLKKLISKWHETPNQNEKISFENINVEKPKTKEQSKLTNNTSLNQTNTANTSPKYQLLLNSSWQNKSVISNSNNTDLIKAVLLYDDKNDVIPQKSSEYEKISFKASPTEGILLKHSTILKNSKPGNYIITASFGNQTEEFRVTINRTNVEISNFTESFINKDWLEQMISSLQKSPKFEKIISTLITLSDLTNKSNSLTHSETLIVTFLIRAVLEYVSNAYVEHYEGLKNNSTPETNLPKLVKLVSEDMYSRKGSQFTLEKKKAIKANDDIELLNGVIHDYTTTASNQDFKRIFAKYIPYIESVILSIEKNR